MFDTTTVTTISCALLVWLPATRFVATNVPEVVNDALFT